MDRPIRILFPQIAVGIQMDTWLLAAVWMAVGLVVLILGGDFLVRGASALAAIVGMAPLVIGLTVVAFGTSAPELAVTVGASYSGVTDLAIGNVVGSNIFNILAILGLSALIRPLAVDAQLIRLDVPLMIFAAILLVVMGWDGMIGRLDGGLLFSLLWCYLLWSVYQARKESAQVQRELERLAGLENRPRSALVQATLIIVGLGLLTAGSYWLVRGSVALATALGISELLIGLTILAVGTSLPEAAVSVMAALRGQREIAVGNVVGSNIFNVLAVLGISALVAPRGIVLSPAALGFDIPVMIAVCVLCVPIFFTGAVISRWEGFLFFGYYVAYMAYLVLAATGSGFARPFGEVILGIFVPATVILVLIGVFRALRRKSSKTASA
jgi:cation:H+ antiporter